jgi:hypothetical protein
MLSTLQQFLSSRYSSRDQLGILLALVIGTAGLIFIFLLHDPILDLAPQIPMLSPQDWPGSYANQELSVRETVLAWNEERKFFQTLLLNNYVISQEAVWYADPSKAAASWQRFVMEYEATHNNEQASVVSFTDNAINKEPESTLFCRAEGIPNADDQHVCVYFAHWEHWVTQVMFFQNFEPEGFQSVELQQITARVDQRLMSAQVEPCYWFFCTGQQENEAP